MRVLHVGVGYRPWIVNGLVIYSEAVMDAQVGHGHRVGYFFRARHLPRIERTFLRRWRRRGVEMYELVNSDLVVGRHRGTPDPMGELAHGPSEAAFGRVLEDFRPELVHVHDLGGLPSSLLDIARRGGLPVVVTMHDYQLLCPTIKLYDADEQVCLRRAPGAMCAVCCADAPADNRDEVARTLVRARARVRDAVPMLDELVRRAQSRGLGAAAFARAERALGVSAPPADGDPAPRRQSPGGARPPGRPLRAPAHAYQTRRDVNLERLNRADALVIGSQRAADVIRELGVAPRRLHVLALNPPHIESLTLRRAEDPGRPLRFVALNACNSAQKGAELIVAAVARLAERGFGGTYRLAVHGWVVPSLRAELAAHPEVELRGDYRVEDLDALLEDADVGLFPSVWEEVYGFVGLEFIAKGIPVIGNARGAIPEYVRPGETGWLNHSCTAAELADLMAAAITDPDRVARLAASTAAARDRFVRPFAEGLAALAAVYDELAGRRRAHDTTP